MELHLYVPLAPGPKSNQVWNMPHLATPNVYIGDPIKSSLKIMTLLDGLKSNLYPILFGRILSSARIIVIWLTNAS